MWKSAGRGGQSRRRACDWIVVALKGKGDVDEGGEGPDRGALLCMFDKVPLTGLVFGVPVEYIKLCMCKWLIAK